MLESITQYMGIGLWQEILIGSQSRGRTVRA
jgi:hypothetical protein